MEDKIQTSQISKTEDELQSHKSRSVNDIDHIISKNLKVARSLLGLTQTDFSGILNVSFQQVQKYERCSNRISASMLYLLSNKLGVDVSFFFINHESQDEISSKQLTVSEKKNDLYTDSKLNKEFVALYRYFTNLDPDVKKKVLSLMATIVKQK